MGSTQVSISMQPAPHDELRGRMASQQGSGPSGKPKLGGDAGVESGNPSSCRPSKTMLGLGLVLSLQVWSIFSIEGSAGRMQYDLEVSQQRIHGLLQKLSAVEHSALKCYEKLNSTEEEIAKESEIINDETRTLRNLTARQLAEVEEIHQLRATVQSLNASLIKSKITLRYEMEERVSAEKAAQASQDSMQILKDQLLAAQEDNKGMQKKLHANAAKAQQRLSKAEKKAKEEASARQKYMEGMLTLQNKLGRTQSLLDDAAMNVANIHKSRTDEQQPNEELGIGGRQEEEP